MTPKFSRCAASWVGGTTEDIDVLVNVGVAPAAPGSSLPGAAGLLDQL